MLQNILGIGAAVIIFGLAIFFHELGHFFFARIRGVGVEAFAIGMGPRMFAWVWGDTEYSIRWFPVGGFVKLHQIVREEAIDAETQAAIEAKNAHERGHDPPDKADPESIGKLAHEDMEALYDKGVVTKLLVFTGGVFFNYLTAIAAMFIVLVIGSEEPVPGEAKIGAVSNAAMLEAGLQKSDVIIEIEGSPVANIVEFSNGFDAALKAGDLADGFDVRVDRGGTVTALSLPPMSEDDKSAYFDTENEAFEAWTWWMEPIVGGVMPYSPAGQAGLKDDDRIVAINGNPISQWDEMTEVIRANPDSAVTLKVQREAESELLTLVVVPEENPEQPGTGLIGIINGAAETEIFRLGVGEALIQAPVLTTRMGKQIAVSTYGLLGRAIFKGEGESLKRNVGGPIAIADMARRVSHKGVIELIEFFIMLNLVLAVMNLLPLPVLDGGFIVISLIEGITRRPVPTRIIEPIYMVFALGFITLFVLISFQDILKIVFKS